MDGLSPYTIGICQGPLATPWFCDPTERPLRGIVHMVRQARNTKSLIDLNAVHRAPENAVRRIPARLRSQPYAKYAAWLKKKVELDLLDMPPVKRVLRSRGVRTSLLMHEYLRQINRARNPIEKQAPVIKRRLQRAGFLREAYRLPATEKAGVMLSLRREFPEYYAFSSFEQTLSPHRRLLHDLLRRRTRTYNRWDHEKERPFPWPPVEQEFKCRFWDYAIMEILRHLRDCGPRLGSRNRRTAVSYILAIICPEVWGKVARLTAFSSAFIGRCDRLRRASRPAPALVFLRR